MKIFTASRIEGGLFSADLFEQLIAEELEGQKPKDFSLPPRRSLTEEIATAFSDAQALWTVFKHHLERLPEKDPATSETREKWMIRFFTDVLGYEIKFNKEAYLTDGLTFAISHRAGESEDSPPIHIVGFRQDLGRLAPSGRPRLSPHALMQEFLNRTEALWGIVTNGKILRLLRDSKYVRKQCYVEFDLESIFEQHLFEDFTVLFRLLHRTRLPKTNSDAEQCLLEKYYQHSLEQGGRVRDRLRMGVKECIKELANGFLEHPVNKELKLRISIAEGNERITPQKFYEELLRLIYRFLFLLVSEDRGLISSNELYLKHYSISRFRKLIDQKSAYSKHHDLWLSLQVLWKLFSDEKLYPQVGNNTLASVLDLPILNGELFNHSYFDGYFISNERLLKAMSHLINYDENGVIRRVNYSALDVEELGSVYESLLDEQPLFLTTSSSPSFELQEAGSERKSTGSYYTPSALVSKVVDLSLTPIIEERLKKAHTQQEKEHAILSIKVLDPACGSGHFLLASARKLAKELARIRTGEEEPAPNNVREAMREVVSYCIYGVDKNPLAVELCKVALWLESYTHSKPLSFLDHRIQCGDSLLGVKDMNVLRDGVPDSAFKPVELDDKELAKKLKNQNRGERSGQWSLFHQFDSSAEIESLSQSNLGIQDIPDDSPSLIHQKKELYCKFQETSKNDRIACDIWLSAFFQSFFNSSSNKHFITSDTLARFLSHTAHPQILSQVNSIASGNRFFHWQVVFPEVFRQGGFDVVVGNPPWERIKLQDKEFFQDKAPEIANALNAYERKKLIEKLKDTNPELYAEYQAELQRAYYTSKFIRESGEYPLTGTGDMNLYAVFAERMVQLLKENGRGGMVLPTGIATDYATRKFFQYLIDNGYLVSLYDFENKKVFFPDVDSRYKFCLLIVEKRQTQNRRSQFAFFCHTPDDLQKKEKIIEMTKEDISLINPNTQTLPIFRTVQDAELTKYFYEQLPVLVDKNSPKNDWDIRFISMFNMANYSNLFLSNEKLKDSYKLAGNRLIKDEEIYYPLYEAKMIWLYDHRWGSFEGIDKRQSVVLLTPSEEQHANANYFVQPFYWISKEAVEDRLKNCASKWFLVFRKITNATNERTGIFSIIPISGAGDSLIAVFSSQKLLLLMANLSSIIFDWVIRQKIGGVNLNFFYAEQFPVFPLEAYDEYDELVIIPRALELIYTSWDMKPFADDVWNMSSNEVREAIKRQWKVNKEETGGVDVMPSDWLIAYPEIDLNGGIQIPPFRWNERRRREIKAELDVYFAKKLGLNRKQVRYILDPADLTERELENIMNNYEEIENVLDKDTYIKRCESSQFSGESFRVLKDKEIRVYGCYLTRRLVLEKWDKV